MMKKPILTILLVLVSVCTLFAQNSGALLPEMFPVFVLANGTTPAALGFVCTTASGGNTNQATYNDADLAGGHVNQNPIRLSAAGRAILSNALVSIYLQALSYRITLYAAGTGNTCNGVTVGTQIWQQDDVYDMAQLFTLSFATKLDDKVCHPSQYAGASEGVQVAACIAVLPSTGGRIDGSGLEGAGTYSSNIWSGITKPITFTVGSGTKTISASTTIPANVTLQLVQGAILSQAISTTLTINGGLEADLSQHFAGSGSFDFGSAKTAGIYPHWWYTGSGAWNAAILSAATAAASGKLQVLFPCGGYSVTDQIDFALDRVNLLGGGQQCTIIQFDPSATGKAAFAFKKATAVTIVQVSVRGMSFDAAADATTGTKTAIRVTDGEEVIIDDIAVSNWTSTGKDCIGLQLRGRQAHSISNLTINADNPISIEDNPNSVIDIDHYHFFNLYLIADVSQPVVKIATGVNLTDVTFDGYEAWVLGKHGLYWVDTTSIIVSSGLRLDNVRWEQATDVTGYFIRIEHNTNLYGLQLKNLYGALSSNGFYFRKVLDANMEDVNYLGALVALNADTTVNGLEFTNTRFNNGAATVTLTAYSVSGTYRLGTGIRTFLPNVIAAATLSMSLNPSKTQGFSQLEPLSFTIAANTVAKLAEDTLGGMVFVYTDSDVSCIFAVTGGTHTSAEISDPFGQCDIVAGGNNFNVYWDGGTTSYRLQNNTAGSRTFKIVTIGKGER